MKITCVIGKIIQEDPYEPIRIELGMEKITEVEKKSSIVKEYKDMAEMLQDTIDDIYLNRVKNRRD